jgi:dienelactone hydrolase
MKRVIASLREQGVTTIGATAYCFGARLAVDLAVENITKAVVIAHPSLLQVPEDIEVCLWSTGNRQALTSSTRRNSKQPPTIRSLLIRARWMARFLLTSRSALTSCLETAGTSPVTNVRTLPDAHTDSRCGETWYVLRYHAPKRDSTRLSQTNPILKKANEDAFQNTVQFFFKHL